MPRSFHDSMSFHVIPYRSMSFHVIPFHQLRNAVVYDQHFGVVRPFPDEDGYFHRDLRGLRLQECLVRHESGPYQASRPSRPNRISATARAQFQNLSPVFQYCSLRQATSPHFPTMFRHLLEAFERAVQSAERPKEVWFARHVLTPLSIAPKATRAILCLAIGSG